MKQSLLVFGLVLILTASAHTADTPIDKGSVVLGGEVYFSSESGELYEYPIGESRTSFVFSPTFGYFIAPGLFIGAEVLIHKTWQGENRHATGFLAGPSIGFYYNPNPGRADIKGTFYPFIKGSFGLGRATNEWPISYPDGQIDSGKSTNNETRFGGEAGALLMLSNAVAATFSVTVGSRKISIEYEIPDSFFDQEDTTRNGLSVSVGVGIAYFIY